MVPEPEVSYHSFNDDDGHHELINYTIDGLMHREDGPASISKLNGIVIDESYIQRGAFHREDGPAFISYHHSGIRKGYHYYINGDRCCINDKPSMVLFDTNGKLKNEIYYADSTKHRTTGPAHIKYNSDGSIAEQLYYKNNKDITDIMKQLTPGTVEWEFTFNML